MSLFEFLDFGRVPLWLLCLAIGGGYFLLVYAVCRVADYFFGSNAADWVLKTLGFPLLAVAWLVSYLFQGLSWPWRYRNSRLLKEVFGIENNRHAPAKVQIELTLIARALNAAFAEQERARLTGNEKAINIANRMVQEHKKQFWFAHSLAKKNGYRVGVSFQDHLY